MHHKNINYLQGSLSVVKKLFFLVIFSTVFTVALAQQNPKIKIEENNPSIKRVFECVERQSGMRVAYDGGFDLTRRVLMPSNELPLTDVLNLVLKGTSRDYSINGNFIIIRQLEQPEVRTSAIATKTLPQTPKAKSVKGVVLDANSGKGIYSAEIKASVNSKEFTVVSDDNGLFEFKQLPVGDYDIIASHPIYGSVQMDVAVNEYDNEPIALVLSSKDKSKKKSVSTYSVDKGNSLLPVDSYMQGVVPQMQFSTPRWALKTNLLWDATTTINFGVEFKVGKRWTIDIPVNFNNWTFSKNKKFKNFLVQPEARLWMNEPFNGHFIGFHGHLAYYNIGGIKLPFNMFKELEDKRYEGNLFGAGISYGYQWMLSKRLSMEATFGVGYAYIHYKKSECRTCGFWEKKSNTHFFGPTKLGLSLIYIIR